MKQKNKTMDIFKVIGAIALIILMVIIYGNINPLRNFLLIVVFIALFGSLVGLISIVVESIDTSSLKKQLPEKEAQFSYMLYVNFIALYISELFLGKMSYLSLIYLLFALIFFYMSLQNYFLKDKEDERKYDLLYTIVIALTLAIVKTVIDYCSGFLNIDVSHIIINIVITVIAIALFVYGIKIVDEKRLRTNFHESNMDKE